MSAKSTKTKTKSKRSKNIAQAFVKEAATHVGELGSDWTWPTYGVSNIEWCAEFVCAVSKRVGILNKCIHESLGAGGMIRDATATMGTYHEGPKFGGTYIPVMGDLIQFKYSSGGARKDADHIGIVYSCDGSNVETIEGNAGNSSLYYSRVKHNSYSIGWGSIAGYFHPNWSLVNGVEPEGTFVGGYTGDLYNTKTTRKDMTIREIGYLDAKFSPSVAPSKIKLSAINYTTLLAAAFKLVAPTADISTSSGNGSANTDKLSGNCKIVVDYLIQKGLNAAAACGIAGNIKHESGFNTGAIGDHNTSFGICQWHNDRGSKMKTVAGTNWAHNLTGQLDYLWQELNGSYSSNTLIPIGKVPNSKSGCMSAADTFVRNFEVPADVDNESLKRQASAAEIFSKVVILSADAKSPAGKTITRTQSGKLAAVAKTIVVPGTVSQTGLIRSYTNYSAFFSKWSSNTIQRTLADIWSKQGKPQSRNIATIDGCYLIAMTLTFGTTGDIVTIELANGDKINAIIADSKGDGSAAGTTRWGHLYGSESDIVEWEAFGDGNSGLSKIELGTWAGQKVTKVYNRGSYLR